jgi:hypothetical protein
MVRTALTAWVGIVQAANVGAAETFRTLDFAGGHDLAATADGTVYCLFEKGKAGAYGNINIVSFPLQKVKQK